jgi:chemotaxis protein methyltransferase CheR
MKHVTPVQRTRDNSKLGHGDYLRFRDLVLERSGLHFPEKKRTDLEIGLDKALQSMPAAVIQHVRLLELDPYYHFLKEAATPLARAEMERLINLLTIGETHFFRDSAQFDALATQILPELIRRKRAAAAAVRGNPPGVPQLRLWSAGCASGEEAYSLAILLHELIPDLKDWRILLLATDINQDSLTRARQALYSDWSFRESRAKTSRSLYFTPQDKSYRLRDHIRQMVTFAPLNLIEDSFPAVDNNTVSMDLIICRNVTIYFTEETTRRLVYKFYQALVEDGWLVVGHSELSLATYRAFQARTFPNTVMYQKTGQPTSWPADWEWLDSAGSNLSTPTPMVWPMMGVGVSDPSTQGEALTPTGASPRRDPIESPKPKAPIKAQTKPLSSWQTNALPSAKAAGSGALIEPNPYNRAKLLLSKGYADQAVVTLEKQLDKVPKTWHAQAHSLLARAYADQGRWDQARRWGESAVKLDNLLTEAYYTLALVNEQEGNVEQALVYLKKVIYLDREGPLPYFNLAMLYKKRGEVNSARRTLNNIIKILTHWPPDKIIPDSGGVRTARLLNISQQALNELGAEDVKHYGFYKSSGNQL